MPENLDDMPQVLRDAFRFIHLQEDIRNKERELSFLNAVVAMVDANILIDGQPVTLTGLSDVAKGDGEKLGVMAHFARQDGRLFTLSVDFRS